MLFDIARDSECLGNYALVFWDAISGIVITRFNKEMRKKRRMSKEDISRIIKETSDVIMARKAWEELSVNKKNKKE
jgi:hypothetical protein